MTNQSSNHWENYWTGAPQSRAVTGERPGDHFDGAWRAFFGAAMSGAADGPQLVVDLACGAGVVTRRAIEAAESAGASVDWRFVGVDYAPGAAANIANISAPNTRVFGVAADAAKLPLRDGEASIVVSQFGVEYAGPRAFAEAARITRPGGRLQIIAHYRNGAIFRECEENAETLAQTLRSDLFPAFRKFVIAGDARAAKLLQRSLSRLGAVAQKRDAAAARLVERLCADMAQMANRRRAYAAEEVTGWAVAMRTEIEQYRARMLAMVSAALDRQQVADAIEQLSAGGLTVSAPEAINILEADPPAAWLINARRD